MPIKFFQNALVNSDKTKSIDKINAGEEVLSISFKQGFAEQKNAKVLKEHAIFPKQSWNGFKISWDGGSFYSTENQLVLLANHETLPVRRLEAGQHDLLSKNFDSIKITKVESGKVLCGRKRLYLEGDDNNDDRSLHFINVSGIWVGDSFLEDKLDASKNKVQYSDAYVFPGNPVVRGMRLLMMKMMGEKEED